MRPERHGPIYVELISVGRELLRGRIPDTNAQTLARTLTHRGALIRRITVVDDNVNSISNALREALDRNPNLVITSGGLGPAEEDRTLHGVSDALGLPLNLDHPAKAMVEEAYARMRQRGVVHAGGLTAAREKLCTIPVGSIPVPNELGISPGVLVRLAGGSEILCLPGMPNEMQAVFEAAMPLLKSAPGRSVAQREIEAPTADESALAPLLDRLAGEFPGVWINSRPAGSRKTGGKILIHLEASGDDQREADSTVDGVVKRLLALAAGSP